MDINKIHIVPLTSIDELNNEICRALYSFWCSLSAGHKGGFLDLVKVPEAVPWLMIIEPEEDGHGLKFRLVGSDVALLTDHDLTGQTLDTSGPGAPLSSKFANAVLEARGPVYSNDSFEAKYKGATFWLEETVALPLFDEQDALDGILLLHGPRPRH